MINFHDIAMNSCKAKFVFEFKNKKRILINSVRDKCNFRSFIDLFFIFFTMNHSLR